MPFRIGHHFASKLTDYGRGQGLKLEEIPFAEVQRIYSQNANAALPLLEHEFCEIISAETVVFGKKGLGGPQITDIKIAIAASNNIAITNGQLLAQQKSYIKESIGTLSLQFSMLGK